MESAWGRSYSALDGTIRLGIHGHLSTDDIRVEGRIPTALNGSLYRTGPARFRLGNTRYKHWFDGDGMVQRFRFAQGRVSHRGELLHTSKLKEEETQGRFLYDAFGTSVARSRPPPSGDAVNPANINMLSMGPGVELLALWEGGSASRINEETLEFEGFKEWSASTKGAPFSAHPRRAVDGTLWNFGYKAGSGKLLLYEISANGVLRRQQLIDAPQADMVHDFAITERYLVFLLMPLYLKEDRAPLGDLGRYEWRESEPLIALIVDKVDFKSQQFELPNGGFFHLGNAWEDGEIIHLHYARYTHFLTALKCLEVNRADVDFSNLASWTHATINPRAKRASQLDSGQSGVEFPRFDLRRSGIRTQYTLLIQVSRVSLCQANYGYDTVLALNGAELQRFTYPPGWLAEEHIHVPSGERDGQGWVLGTAFDSKAVRSALSVFDAEHISDGPIGQALLDYALPIGLHGQFV